MNKKELISFQNVSFSYETDTENPKTVLQDISFTVMEGEFLCILGHNGSGKSTVAKLSNALLLPDQGRILVDGVDTGDEEQQLEIRKKIGIVFQNPDNQIVASIVEEDVAFGPENLCLPREEIRSRVDAALKAVDMYDRRFHETHRLSGGQKQRVAIAGMIAMRPKCIFFDEPTAMLDPKGRRSILNTIHRLNREYGITVVYITHFMDEAAEADRVMLLSDGRILTTGTPSEVFTQTDLIVRCGLELPDPAKLSFELSKLGISLTPGVLTEQDFIDAFQRFMKESQ